MGIIYKIFNDINEKVYIGQTRQKLSERWYAHKYNAENNLYDYYIYKAMRKHGIDNFHIEVVEECPNEELNEKEIFYIKKFNSYAPNGYNLTLGGDGHSKYDYNEVLKHYYECDRNIAETSRRYGYSYDTISNVLNANNVIRRTSGEYQESPIYECDVDNNIIKKFKNTKEIVETYPELNMTRDGISNYLARPRTSRYRGKYFCRVSDYESYKKENHHNQNYVSVLCCELNKEFETMSDAARYILEKGLSKGKISTIVTNINYAIKNGWKSYGYTWKRFDD